MTKRAADGPVPNELLGWDTELAAPFDLIASLPPIFTVSSVAETFSAKDEEAKYWLVRECEDKLWLYYLERDGARLVKHFFHPCWSLRDSRIYSAVRTLTELIRQRKAAGKLSLDVAEFKQEVGFLRSTVSLVAPGTKLCTEKATTQALEYVCLNLELRGAIRMYLHEHPELHGGGAVFRLPQPLPNALSWILPCLEVWLRNGNLIDLQTPFIEFGAAPSGSPLERLKAFARLFQAGFPEDVAKSLDDYIGMIEQA